MKSYNMCILFLYKLYYSYAANYTEKSAVCLHLTDSYLAVYC